jgi:hypothetical protein
LINRFIDQLSQVSSSDFCIAVPCVERGFGGPNGRSERRAQHARAPGKSFGPK